MITFEFGLDAVILQDTQHDGLPVDLVDCIGASGDQFRDDFTRLCLYLSLHDGQPTAGTDVTVLIGTEYGNTGALADLQRAAAAKGKLLSAQAFPNATSSSAAAFVSIGIGATGRNMTLNGGPLTPVLTLWQAMSVLRRRQSSICHLLVGDVYTPEARQDVVAQDPGAVCHSGIMRAVLTDGDDFTAEFDFGSTPAGTPSPERNGAFATAGFLRSVRDLPPGGRATLRCATPGGRQAAVTVARHPERKAS